jgi:hypothetical protein
MRRTRAAADWGTTTLRFLQRSAFDNRHLTSSFEWLKSIGLVPEGVERMDIRQVITDLDPENIPVSYLAASAHEWDTWGEASPVDFIKALGYETRGAKRDLIVETLMALGREQREAVAA